MPQERAIDANKVIQSLQARIGQLVSQYETEIAYRDAIISGYDEQSHSHEEDGGPSEIQISEE